MRLIPIACEGRVQRFAVLGVGVDDVTERDVLRFAKLNLSTRNPVQIVTVNVEYVMLARKFGYFARVLAGADLAVADGAGVLWAIRRQGARVRRRVGGSDLIWSMSCQAAKDGHSVFLLGGRTDIANMAAKRLQARFPTLRVAGAYSGSPSRAEEASISRTVRESAADILFVAYGAPAQDMWIARNLRATGVFVALGVGGSFDYVAGQAQRAPTWMQDHGLEWLWRLLREPWRWRRMLSIPQFIVLIVRERVSQYALRLIARLSKRRFRP